MKLPRIPRFAILVTLCAVAIAATQVVANDRGAQGEPPVATRTAD